jgi:hypothetical protein
VISHTIRAASSGLAAASALMILVATAPAGAQSSAVVEPRVAVGGSAVILGPMSVGTASADYRTPRGDAFPLFHTDARLAASPGVEGRVTISLAPRVALEAAGAWMRPPLVAGIDDDYEGADAVRARLPLSRFSAEGAVLVAFARHGRAVWFVRGGAGWMREMAGWGTYAEDGAIGDLGLGVKYWWHTRARDDTGRLALRVDARLAGRAGGLIVGTRAVRVAPLVSAGLDIAW